MLPKPQEELLSHVDYFAIYSIQLKAIESDREVGKAGHRKQLGLLLDRQAAEVGVVILLRDFFSLQLGRRCAWAMTVSRYQSTQVMKYLTLSSCQKLGAR